MKDFLRNPHASYPVPTLVSCGSLCRSAEHLVQVLAQFEVETNPRYAAREGNTYCNIFVWDATRALGCEIPHWLNGRELNANAVCDWLRREGVAFGWQPEKLGDAKAAANVGRPVVAVWKNPAPGQSGHVAMVLPSTSDGMRIAQAGKTNYFDVPIAKGFGELVVTFWVHA